MSAGQTTPQRAARDKFILANWSVDDFELAKAMVEAGLFSKKTVGSDIRGSIRIARKRLGGRLNGRFQ